MLALTLGLRVHALCSWLSRLCVLLCPAHLMVRSERSLHEYKIGNMCRRSALSDPLLAVVWGALVKKDGDSKWQHFSDLAAIVSNEFWEQQPAPGRKPSSRTVDLLLPFKGRKRWNGRLEKHSGTWESSSTDFSKGTLEENATDSGPCLGQLSC